MNERIRKLRKALDLTQQEFAERIGIKRNTLANYEIGRNIPIDAVINLICREFNVNREWLETGRGEMLVAAPTDELDALARRYKLRLKEYVMIEKLVQLPTSKRDDIFRFMQDVVDSSCSCGANPDSLVFPDAAAVPDDPADPPSLTVAQMQAMVAEHARKEKEARAESSASSSGGYDTMSGTG